MSSKLYILSEIHHDGMVTCDVVFFFYLYLDSRLFVEDKFFLLNITYLVDQVVCIESKLL